MHVGASGAVELQSSGSRGRDIGHFEFVGVEDVDRGNSFDFRNNWLDGNHDIVDLGGTGRKLVRRLGSGGSSKGILLLIRMGSWRGRRHGEGTGSGRASSTIGRLEGSHRANITICVLANVSIGVIFGLEGSSIRVNRFARSSIARREKIR